MNTLPEIILPDELMRACREFGDDMAKSNLNGEKMAYQQTAVTDVNVDPEKLTNARAAECAACLFLGMDPLPSLDWQTHKTDGGSDFIIGNGYRVDVKSSTHPAAERLVSPVTLNEYYKKAKFDVLIFAWGTGRAEWELRGWTSKSIFAVKHSVADGTKGLVEGTWYMHQDDLWHMDDLRVAVAA